MSVGWLRSRPWKKVARPKMWPLTSATPKKPPRPNASSASKVISKATMNSKRLAESSNSWESTITTSVCYSGKCNQDSRRHSNSYLLFQLFFSKNLLKLNYVRQALTWVCCGYIADSKSSSSNDLLILKSQFIFLFSDPYFGIWVLTRLHGWSKENIMPLVFTDS